MKILLAVSLASDPHAVSRYIAKRFENRNIYIDILTVIPRSDLPTGESGHQLRQKAIRLTNTISAILRERHDITACFCHIEFGDPSQLILQRSKRWRSSLILIEAPKHQGMLTAFRRDGVSHQLFKKAQCSLELIRPEAKAENNQLKVLIPLSEHEVETFPFQKLREMIWLKSSQITLVTTLPPAIDLSRIEASPAALLNEKRELIAKKALLEGKLSALRNRLTSSLDHRFDIDFNICEGNLQEAITKLADSSAPSLVVMRSEENANPIRKIFSIPPPASFAVSSGFSVLLLRNSDNETNVNGRLRRVFSPSLLKL